MGRESFLVLNFSARQGRDHLCMSAVFTDTCVSSFQDPASSTASSEADSDPREAEPVTINYKPSPLQMKIGEFSALLTSSAVRNELVKN